MIDTDKYEGHLPFTGDEMVWVWSKSGMSRMKSVKQFNVTGQLLEDAPVLFAEVKQLRKYSNVLEKLMGSLDSRDEGDWILLETIDELMKEEGIARWSQEKDKTETNLI